MSREELYSSMQGQIRLIAEEAKGIIMAVLSSEKGVNPKVGVNTLVNSDLFNQLDYNVDDIEVVNLLVNDYIQYIESGMQPGHWVNEEYLLPWMVDKNIPTDNNTLYNIQYSIWKWGITPRPIMDDAWKMLDEYFEDFADKVIEILMTDVEEFFD